MSACLFDHRDSPTKSNGGEAGNVTKAAPEQAAENRKRMTFIRADAPAQFISSCPYGKIFTYVDVYLHFLAEDGIYI